MEIELLLQEFLDIFQLEVVILLEEGDDSLKGSFIVSFLWHNMAQKARQGRRQSKQLCTSRCHGLSFSAPLTFLSGLKWPRVRSCLRRRLIVRSSTSIILAMSPFVSLGACSRCTSTFFSDLSSRREFAFCDVLDTAGGVGLGDIERLYLRLGRDTLFAK